MLFGSLVLGALLIEYAGIPNAVTRTMPNELRLVTLTDSAKKTRVQIAPERGAIVTSFTVGDCELLYMDTATLADRTKNVRGGIPILFPIAGKLLDDTWQRDGKVGTMLQHGFARQLPWQVEPQVQGQSQGHEVSMSLASSAATLAQYPWAFQATLTYALNDACLRTTLRVRNTGDVSMPYALGFHPYFQVPAKERAKIASRATRVYNNVLKRVEAFCGFDFASPEVDLHLLDHGSNTAELDLGDERIVVRASNDFAVWVVWSLVGKEFICLEPWTAPGNALNSGEQLTVLPAGATHESWMEIATA